MLQYSRGLSVVKTNIKAADVPSEYTSIAGDKEEKEIFNFAYEAALNRTGGDGNYRELDGSAGKSNMWPKEKGLQGFIAVIKECYSAVLDLARHLFRLFAFSFDLPEDYFGSMTTHLGGNARLIYFPPRKVLTSTTPGLEILNPSGQWHVASYIPDSLL
ncbi:hypothetical protein P3342_008678 [Pyrenophora teres f. teres]|nr:hypothetical protein HRS9139_07412 [Pyrenophora teres f. teres]KAE8829386.1 hypothetical protein HRS9122_09201 [Pyrenophora teres f. teres]KAE8830792.1 hypothetical protein PTNB85_07379 [Pyrenophora teres f. teres]KAE8857210.1 hypothetical protein PTNB29_08277 [Pyrenophora teres f. teres]KAE8863444.1 hypothetical protein PTNB73_06651 [Pyrenophora teres f. teres]